VNPARATPNASKHFTELIDSSRGSFQFIQESPIVEIGTAMVTAKPVANNFCGVWGTTQGVAVQLGVIKQHADSTPLCGR
jgi:hypothetical protein